MGRTGTDVRRLEISYSPLASQRKFHESDAKFKGFSGPVGSGKSQALCQEAIRMAYINTGRTGLLGAPTFPMLRDATQSTLFEILEHNEIGYDHSKSENTLTFKDTGSRILFRAVEDFERLRGTNLAWFGLDELTYTLEDSWLRLVARLRDPKATRAHGFAVWTPKGFDWVYRRFVADAVEGYELVRAQPRENVHLTERFPDYYKNLEAVYDERFFQQEVLGMYLNMNGGMVYSAFDPERNVMDLPVNPAKTLCWALDFNVDPLSSLVVQLDRNCVHVIDEIVLRHGSTAQACEAFVERYGKHQMSVEIYGDCSGHQQRTTGNTDYQIIEEYFRTYSSLKIEMQAGHQNPPVRDRVNLTNAKLRSAAGESTLLIDPKCKELIKDFEQVAFKEGSYHIDKDRDRLRTHVSDALGYLIWDKFKPGAPVGEQTRRLLSS
jgi:hypothetical protein